MAVRSSEGLGLAARWAKRVWLCTGEPRGRRCVKRPQRASTRPLQRRQREGFRTAAIGAVLCKAMVTKLDLTTHATRRAEARRPTDWLLSGSEAEAGSSAKRFREIGWGERSTTNSATLPNSALDLCTAVPREA